MNPFKAKVYALTVANLKLGETYTLEVRGSQNQVIDTRVFSALDHKAVSGKIAIASCIEDRDKYVSDEVQVIWDELVGQKPDAVFLIGDNVYADYPPEIYKTAEYLGDERYIWQRHLESRQLQRFYQMKELIPTFTVWDDHDYGTNNGNREYELKAKSKEIYRKFFPVFEEEGFYQTGPGMSSKLALFGVDMYFLDGRSFRAPKIDPLPDFSEVKLNLPSSIPYEQEHLGAEQRQWLFDKLKTPSKHTWLVKGDQFFGAYHRFESWQRNQTIGFYSFLNQLKSVSTEVVFFSGDIHSTELQKIPQDELGYETYELTTSPLAGKTFDPDIWEEAPNSRQLEYISKKLNYTVVDIKEASTGEFEAQGWSLGKKLEFRRAI